jgi:DNA-binding response OmpR family regulator
VFRTTRLQSKVLLRLLRRGLCSKDMLHDTVEENRGRPDEPTHDKIVQVMICHLRKKLKPFDIPIKTHHGSGYSMTADDRQRVVQLLAGSVKCPEEHLNIGLDT